MIIVTDDDYRTHSVPCYPQERFDYHQFLRGLENCIVLEVDDDDYPSSSVQMTITRLLLVA